jgi:hypothetical protein
VYLPDRFHRGLATPPRVLPRDPAPAAGAGVEVFTSPLSAHRQHARLVLVEDYQLRGA